MAFAALSISLFQGRLPLRTFAVKGRIDRLSFSPDGHLLAALVHGENITVWDARTWRRLNTYPGAFDACYFLPNSRTLITSRTYSTGTDSLADAINHGRGLTMAQWKQEDSTLQYRIQQWTVGNDHAIKTFVTSRASLDASAPKLDKAVLRCLAPTPGISFVSTADGHEIHFLPTRPTVEASLSPDSRWIALVDFTQHQGEVILWNTQTWQSKTLPAPVGPMDANFSPDGQWFEASSAKNIVLWRVSDWHRTAVFSTDYDDAGRSQFSLDSKQIITDGSWKKRQPGIQEPPNTALMIWDIASSRKIATLTRQELIFWRLTTRGLITADTVNFSSHLWNTKNGHQLWQGCAGYGSETVISTNGHTLVTAHPENQNPYGGGVFEVRHLP